MSISENQNSTEHEPGSIVRSGEDIKLWFRTDRYFTVANKYYFSTRERREVGPFDNRNEAAKGLELYVDCIDSPSNDADYAANVALRGSCQWARTCYH